MSWLMDPEDVRSLVGEVIGPESKEPLGVYVFGSSDRGAELAREVEREVFFEVFSNTPELLHAEYDAYEARSFFFCVIDHRRRRPAGVLRVIVPNSDGTCSKSLDDIERVWEVSRYDLRCQGREIPLGESWDMATLAVSPQYRGFATAGLTALSLYQSLLRSSVRCGVSWGVAVIDDAVYRMIDWKFEAPFGVFDGLQAKTYLGSELSYPVFSDGHRWRRRIAVANPTMHDLIFDGVGLTAAVRGVSLELAERIVSDIREGVTQRQASGSPPIDLRDYDSDLADHQGQFRKTS